MISAKWILVLAIFGVLSVLAFMRARTPVEDQLLPIDAETRRRQANSKLPQKNNLTDGPAADRTISEMIDQAIDAAEKRMTHDAEELLSNVEDLLDAWEASSETNAIYPDAWRQQIDTVREVLAA